MLKINEGLSFQDISKVGGQMEFQVIDYAEEKQSVFLFLDQFDPTDLHCQRAWISEALALHHTGFSISGGQTQPDSDSHRRRVA